MAIIEVSHVTKEFRLGQLHGLKETLRNAASRLRGRPVEQRQPFKALDDVDFKVEQGEVLGIIGHNGAGKSTLLKILASITSPTQGSIAVRGRVAPLIEVGAGLVPDLTGRENIYINAAILGMRRAEVKAKLDEIIAFAELERFIDTPIKRYSSGMAVRLGFAIATSVNADILIVDEVLAVGDLAFQRKCFDRMEELIKRQGRTVLLVSHNIRQVERLCSRAILLEYGKAIADGKPSEVCDAFFQRSNDKIYRSLSATRSALVRSSGEAEVVRIETIDATGMACLEIESGAALRVQVTFDLKQRLEQPELIIGTHTTDFVYLSGSSTAVIAERPDLDAGRHVVELVLTSFPLAAGVYSVRFVILDRSRRVIFAGDNLCNFMVRPTASEAKEEGLRMLNLPAAWLLNGERLGYVAPLHAARTSALNPVTEVARG
jgi:ABC-type polysaccharide/polyol phosphate transport system ATPase subunit